MKRQRYVDWMRQAAVRCRVKFKVVPVLCQCMTDWFNFALMFFYDHFYVDDLYIFSAS